MSDDLSAFHLLPNDPHDEVVRENTHPQGWINPVGRSEYDLVVVGAGTAGLVSAGVGSLLGAKVALIEASLTGGDCLIAGCVPSKALIRGARAAFEVGAAGQFGVRASGVENDFAAAMDRVRSVRARISRHDAAAAFRDEYGVDVFFGNARFTGADQIDVNGRVLRFGRCIIATGSRPALPPLAGLREAEPLTNETVFNLISLPRRLAVIGGGPLGCELAQAFARYGSQVTIVERGPRLMSREDPEVAELVAHVFEAEGIHLRTQSAIQQVSRENGVARLHLGNEKERDVLEADAILVGAGRSPRVESLNLSAASVRFTEHGVEVDDYLRTSNPKIFAAGDVCLREKFTHTADASARVAAQNALLYPLKRWSRQVIPHVTYTDPEVAQVGVTEAQAAKRGLKLHTLKIPLAEVDRAITDADTSGFLKVHLKRGSDRILGATYVAAHAGESISQITTAMVAKIGLKQLAEVIHPYPTQAEAIKKAADQYARESLNGWTTSLTRRWIGWRAGKSR